MKLSKFTTFDVPAFLDALARNLDCKRILLIDGTSLYLDLQDSCSDSFSLDFLDSDHSVCVDPFEPLIIYATNKVGSDKLIVTLDSCVHPIKASRHKWIFDTPRATVEEVATLILLSIRHYLSDSKFTVSSRGVK